MGEVLKASSYENRSDNNRVRVSLKLDIPLLCISLSILPPKKFSGD